jgi:uncharacterized membrane protein YbhN (UPF0104 family)
MRRRSSLVLAAGGLALAVALLAAARPRAVLALARTARPSGLALAACFAVATLLMRGTRLALVVGRPLGIGRATLVVAVSQLAVVVLPMRLGELAVLPMLHAVGVTGVARGVSFAVVLRFLDLVALLAWAVVAALLVGAPPLLIGVLALAVGAVLAAAALALRRLPSLARRYRRGRPLVRRLVRQLIQVRRELRAAARSPLRLAGIAVASLAVWAGLWGLTASLLAAMGKVWPEGVVLSGVVGAAVGTALPVNAVGNFGTLEAGWTGALVAAGVPAGEALAAGFATHLWSLAFSAGNAALAVTVLALSQWAAPARWRRAVRSASRTPRSEE